MEKEVNLGKEVLKLRKMLGISQKDFALITAMTQDEINEIEKSAQIESTFKRLKISIALERILEHHHEKYPEFVNNKIIEGIEKINPFDSIDDFSELSLLFEKINRNIDNFNQSHLRK